MTQLLIALATLAIIIWIFKTHAEGKAGGSLRHIFWPYDRHMPQGTVQENALDADDESKMLPRDQAQLDYSEINRAYRIADMHFTRGDFEEAEKWFIKVLAIHDEHPESLNRLGVIYIQQNNPRRAEILYRRLFSITQKEPAYYCNYGRCLYNQGRLNEAIEAYENAIKLDTAKPSRFVSVGQIHYEQKNFDKALAYFAHALELDPQNRDYLTVVAELAEVVGDLERLKRSLSKILEIDPYDEAAKKKLAGL
ncbi:MAG: tetratricopeptide repeat protein [Patescibacteria group bacterium]